MLIDIARKVWAGDVIDDDGPPQLHLAGDANDMIPRSLAVTSVPRGDQTDGPNPVGAELATPGRAAKPERIAGTEATRAGEQHHACRERF